MHNPTELTGSAKGRTSTQWWAALLALFFVGHKEWAGQVTIDGTDNEWLKAMLDELRRAERYRARAQYRGHAQAGEIQAAVIVAPPAFGVASALALLLISTVAVYL
jgi:hypothetical protein